MKKTSWWQLVGLLGASALLYSQVKKTSPQEITIPAAGKLETLSGMKWVHMAQLKYPLKRSVLFSLVRELQEVNPDGLVISGGLIDGNEAFDPAEYTTFLDQLAQIAPLYLTVGQEDLSSNLFPYLEQAIHASKATVLDNTWATGFYQEQPFLIMGATPVTSWLPWRGEKWNKIDKKLEGLPILAVCENALAFESLLKKVQAPDIFFASCPSSKWTLASAKRSISLVDYSEAGIYHSRLRPSSSLVVAKGLSPKKYKQTYQIIHIR